MPTNQVIGLLGETLAADYLKEKGYTILERNARTPYGEIDLVACYESTIVFIEVKTRTSTRFGNPEDSITPSKRGHLIASIQAYLQSHPELTGDWRIDVIAIQKTGSPDTAITHFENAIS